MDRMIRIDNRTQEHISKVITWLEIEDNWWNGKVLSVKGLRRNFDTITGKMNEEKKFNGNSNKSSTIQNLSNMPTGSMKPKNYHKVDRTEEVD